MDLPGARAGHSLRHVLGPPVVVPGDVQVTDVDGQAVGRADQVREAVAFGAGRIVAAVVAARGVVELGPGHGDEVGAVGDVQVAVGAVGDVAVVEPDVVRRAVHRHRIVARRAPHRDVIVRVQRAISDAVADDLQVADDDVRRAAEPQMTVHLGPAQAGDGLVRSDADLGGGKDAFDVDDRRRRYRPAAAASAEAVVTTWGVALPPPRGGRYVHARNGRPTHERLAAGGVVQLDAPPAPPVAEPPAPVPAAPPRSPDPPVEAPAPPPWPARPSGCTPGPRLAAGHSQAAQVARVAGVARGGCASPTARASGRRPAGPRRAPAVAHASRAGIAPATAGTGTRSATGGHQQAGDERGGKRLTHSNLQTRYSMQSAPLLNAGYRPRRSRNRRPDRHSTKLTRSFSSPRSSSSGNRHFLRRLA